MLRVAFWDSLLGIAIEQELHKWCVFNLAVANRCAVILRMLLHVLYIQYRLDSTLNLLPAICLTMLPTTARLLSHYASDTAP